MGKKLVIPTGFEPVAYSLGNCRSIRLSYGTLCSRYQISETDCTLLAWIAANFIARWLAPPALAAILLATSPGLGAKAAPLPCEAEGATPAEIAGQDRDGTLRLVSGPRVRLANIVWPDHLEPGQQNKLLTAIAGAIKDQHITWKPASGPDRWGITPAHLFIREKDGPWAPFWLQAGLLEAGLTPAWPDPIDKTCGARLASHERLAIKARKGYWAPRAQTARHQAIAAARDAHGGRRLVALWRVKTVRPWRSLHFVNFTPSFRGGPSIGLTRRQMQQMGDAAKTDPNKNPLLWQGKWIVARFIVGSGGLSRVRVETIDHIGLVE